MKRAALTVKQIERLNQPGRYLDGWGLYLQVEAAKKSRTVHKSWLLRYERGGRERTMGLGSLRLVTLAEAREKALELHKLIKADIDPLEAKREKKKADALAAARSKTFEECADEYFTQHSPKWRSAQWAQQFKNTMRDYVTGKIGKLPVADIDNALMLKVLNQEIIDKDDKPLGTFWRVRTRTADRVRNRIEAVLDWATVGGFRTGDNPARWAGNLVHLLPPPNKIAKVKNFAALPYAELPAFMTALRSHEGADARALEFTILTAAVRSDTTLTAVWSEFDLQKKLWTIPAERMKSGKEHRVPLSDAALALLQKQSRKGDYVFHKDGAPLAHYAMRDVLRKRMNQTVTVHGFRSTFKDWANETTGHANDAIEMALAHTVGSKVEQSYRRGDMFEKRIKLMADWARYCTLPPDAATGDNVVKLQKANA